MALDWMAWTLPTVIFFSTIAVILAAMTAWQVISPSPERRGFLPIPTTPGDRLFVGLLGSAYIHLGWIGLSDATLWGAFAVSLVWLLGVLRWG
jgi:predicted small integral membrane protein